MGWIKRLSDEITSSHLSNIGHALRIWAKERRAHLAELRRLREERNAKAADEKSRKRTERLPDGRIRTVITDPNGTEFVAVFRAAKPKPSAPPDAPKPKRRRRTPEERESDRLKKLAWSIKESQRRAREVQDQQVGIGITHYVWQTMEDERTCHACAANNGKKFCWRNPPPTGHPGHHLCEGEGHCRCLAQPHFDL